MTATETPAIVWLLIAVQVLGLLSAWVARLSEGARCRGYAQCVFLGCLVVVAGTTIVALGLGPGYWLITGMTFPLMVLTVTCDFSHTRRPTVWQAG